MACDPLLEITPGGAVPASSQGGRKLNNPTNFLHMATGITPAMCMGAGPGSPDTLVCPQSRGLDGEVIWVARVWLFRTLWVGPAEGRVASAPVMEAFDVLEDRVGQLDAGGPASTFKNLDL